MSMTPNSKCPNRRFTSHPFVWRESIAVVNHAANDTTNAVVPERLSQAVGRVSGDAERTLRLSDSSRNNI